MCGFIGEHLYSNIASASISFLVLSDLFPARFSHCNSCNLSENFLGLEDENFAFVSVGFKEGFSLSDPAMIAGDLGNLLKFFPLVLLLPKTFSSKYFSFANSNTLKILSKVTVIVDFIN